MTQHITASGNVQVGGTGYINKARITVNAALTGTITVSDGGTVVAIITNPPVGSFFEYWDFATGVFINPSATCEISVSIDPGRSGK